MDGTFLLSPNIVPQEMSMNGGDWWGVAAARGQPECTEVTVPGVHTGTAWSCCVVA